MRNDGDLFAAHLRDPWAPHPVVNRRTICSMGGGGGGGGQQTTQSSSQSGPPTEIAWMLNDLAGQAYGKYQNNPSAPAMYSGEMTAPLSWQTQGALNAMTNRSNYRPPVLDVANRGVTDVIGGKYLDLKSNPYFFDALDASLKPQQEQFMTSVIPGITSAFEGSGRTASPIHAQVVDNAVTSLNRAQADARVKAASDTYQFERGQQGNAISQASQLAGLESDIDLQNINAMLQAGQITDAQAQKLIDEKVQRHNYDQTKDVNWMANIAQLIQSIYPGGTTTGFNTGYSMPSGGNSGSQTAGAITSGVGMALSAAAIIA